ncbi:MAG TPA: GNAT family N-acetyltransferase [Streptosporangiaceae bacterium]|nr:GNAT family N-acetyltransferase [Streptosporangiaceae bacterium]
MTTYPIRPITADELTGYTRVFDHAFHHQSQTGPEDPARASRMEFDRTLAAFDGPEIVGTAGVFSFQMRVPGALVPVAGVTMVSVLPSHRRRGILTSLMRRQLDDVAARGEAVAALWASEAGIYGRFGYGPAAWHTNYRVFRGEGVMVSGPAASDRSLRLRIAEPAAVRAELAKVYELVLAERPGLWARSAAWWDRVLADPVEERGGDTAKRCVLAEDDQGPRGYALFRGRSRWDTQTGLADSQVTVIEAMSADPAATAALWGDLLSRDLTSEVQAAIRPVDDPLLHLLADPRRLRASVSDNLWVRLVDVAAALTQRRYACPVDVVIDVTDRLCPPNEGHWRLATDTAGDGTSRATLAAEGFGGTCERTSAPADVALTVEALGAAYLGGTRLGTLARAGLATEATPGALAALSTALSWDPAPWCPLIF